MDILSNESSLRSLLEKQRSKRIQIVSAFAYSTASFVEKLKARGNTIEIVVGTINAFTDPDFIEAVATILPKGLWVDFRGYKSIHWKLYLIAPKTVIIGSANFTDTGLDMSRDTCVAVRNQQLYNSYCQRIEALKAADPKKVLTRQSRHFLKMLREYTTLHARSQTAKQGAEASSSTTPNSVPTLAEWLDAGNSFLPMFVWNRPTTHTEKSCAKSMVQDQAKVLSSKSPLTKKGSVGSFRHLFVSDPHESKPKLKPGTVLLTARATGAFPTFVDLDIVQRDPVSKYDYLISLPKRSTPQLFQLTAGLRKGLKVLLQKDKALSDATSLGLSQLHELVALEQLGRN
ncbi:MAG: phospholipase D family protein [Rhodanobacter sp.]